MGYQDGIFYSSGFLSQWIMVLGNEANVLWCMEIILDFTVDGKKYDFKNRLNLMFLHQHRYLHKTVQALLH